MTDIRNLVLDILIENEEEGTYLSDIIRAVQEKYAYLEERDRAFLRTLSLGTVEKKLALDYVIDTVSSVKTRKMKSIIRHIIRMAAYEIMYMDHVPSRASVSEAVRLTKKRHMAGLSGFTNAVTRKLAALNDRKALTFPDDRIRYSFPESVFETLVGSFDKETALKIMKSSEERRPLYLRVNSGKCSVSDLKEILKKEGVKTEAAPFGSFALRAPHFDVGRSASFKEGLFSVQDISSMAALEAAGIKKGMKVLDLCAAPGGKACFAAELMEGTGEVLAFDISGEKTEKIEENIKRLGLKNIRTGVNDASRYQESLKESADLVIADLPCSGLGVMNRKVDIKYRIKDEDIDSLVCLQRKILDNAVRYVKKGGRLLYSTCTLTKKENSCQAEYITESLGLKEVCQRQFVQGIDPCDGFYYAVFE